jgi:hypothetical protein
LKRRKEESSCPVKKEKKKKRSQDETMQKTKRNSIKNSREPRSKDKRTAASRIKPLQVIKETRRTWVSHWIELSTKLQTTTDRRRLSEKTEAVTDSRTFFPT